MATGKLRLLFVLETFYPHAGGGATLFFNLTRELAKRGHEVNVLTMQLEGTKRFENIDGVLVHRINAGKVSGLGKYAFAFLAIPKAISLAKNCDIIHTMTYTSALPAIIAAKLHKKPCVINVHEFWGNLWDSFVGGLSGKIHRWIEERIAERDFDSFICPSLYTARCLQNEGGVRSSKISVVYNPFDYDFWDLRKASPTKAVKEHLLEGGYILLWYGHPGVSKGVECLIDALPTVFSTIKNLKVIMIMAPEPHKRYVEMCEKIGQIKGDILLLNPVDKEKLRDILAASNMVVVPSLSEGFGYCAAEAIVMGRQIVASNSGSLPEIVPHKFLAEKKNPRALAEKIIEVYKGGEVPKVLVNIKSSTEYAAEIEQIYRKLLFT